MLQLQLALWLKLLWEWQTVGDQRFSGNQPPPQSHTTFYSCECVRCVSLLCLTVQNWFEDSLSFFLLLLLFLILLFFLLLLLRRKDWVVFACLLVLAFACENPLALEHLFLATLRATLVCFCSSARLSFFFFFFSLYCSAQQLFFSVNHAWRRKGRKRGERDYWRKSKSESEEAAAECDYKQISWLERKSIVEGERSLSVSFAWCLSKFGSQLWQLRPFGGVWQKPFCRLDFYFHHLSALANSILFAVKAAFSIATDKWLTDAVVTRCGSSHRGSSGGGQLLLIFSGRLNIETSLSLFLSLSLSLSLSNMEGVLGRIFLNRKVTFE